MIGVIIYLLQSELKNVGYEYETMRWLVHVTMHAAKKYHGIIMITRHWV